MSKNVCESHEGYADDMQDTIRILRDRLTVMAVKIEIEQSKKRSIERKEWKKFDQAAMRAYVEMATMMNAVIGGEK